MDFAYDGETPAKLFELNYDTPTSLYEAAVFQWIWLKDCIEAGRLPPATDQFNSLQEKLQLALSMLVPKIDGRMHFASVRDPSKIVPP